MSDPIFYNDPKAPVQPVQYQPEFTWLLDFYRHLKPERLLEVGVDWGGTLFQWIKWGYYLKKIVAIDLPGARYGSGSSGDTEAWLGWAKTSEVDLHPILGDSHDPSIIAIAQSYAPYDWIFIDGDHTYEGVKQDYENYYPMLRKGGWFVFHDIVEHDAGQEVGVHKFWRELRDKRGSREFTSYPDQNMCGIGVLEK